MSHEQRVINLFAVADGLTARLLEAIDSDAPVDELSDLAAAVGSAMHALSSAHDVMQLLPDPAEEQAER